jgi:hypothetical protein
MQDLINEFESFLNQSEKRIGYGNDIKSFTGIGTEYLVRDNVIVAKFWNGMLVTGTGVNVDGDTLVSA